MNIIMEKSKNYKCSMALSLLLFIGLGTSVVCAKPIDREKAKQIAQRQIQKKIKTRATAESHDGLNTDVSFEMEGEDNSFYVFNIGDDGGFVVVSGEDATEEILMSSESGHFTAGEMPVNMMSWLNGYSKQIKWLRENGITKEMNKNKVGSFNKYYKLEDDEEKAERLARWDQDGKFGKEDLYNYGLPIVEDDEGHTCKAPTGCTVTAVAQFLYYHQWPKVIGPKSIPSYKTKTEKKSIAGWEKDTEIDWSHINRTYNHSQSYTNEERDAISNLMKMVGAAYKADYKYGGSSASLSNTPAVLQSYFKYGEMEFTYKIKDNDKWLQMIYDELTTNGPVLYRGEDSDDGNHSFIIEGIDGEYVWINWGWGYNESTKTLLSVCDNEHNDYVFDTDQAAIFGAKPDKSVDIDYTGIALRVLTSSLMAKTASAIVRHSMEEDFENVPIQYSYTNIFEDATFDLGFLVENITTGDENFYSLFSRNLKGLKTTTSNLNFSFGKNLDDGVYRIYGASREHGTGNYKANYNKTSQYIEVTISNNRLIFGNVEDKPNESLIDYTNAMGCEYKLYGRVDYSDSRTNPDGVVFYKTDLLLDVKKNGVTKTYVVDRGSIYNTSTYGNMMFPCLLLDVENDRMYVFHNSKDDDEYYGMVGYVFTSPISSVNFTRETVYTHFNCGWFPYFTRIMENGYPELHHFSYAGYYEMISQYDGSEWSTYYVSRMDPSDAEKDGKSHSSFLVVGENRVTDNVAEYCSSEEDNESYTILSVDPGVSGEFKVPRKVSGTPVNSIASYAFSTCDDITSIVIPENITSIEEYAFGSSKNLTSIKVMNPEPIDLSYTYEMGESGESADGGKHLVMTPFELVDKSRCVLYVPQGSREAYSLAIGWGDFQNIEEFPVYTNSAGILEVVNYIMGNPSADFDADSADMNGDDKVNTADIVEIVKKIQTTKK